MFVKLESKKMGSKEVTQGTKQRILVAVDGIQSVITFYEVTLSSVTKSKTT